MDSDIFGNLMDWGLVLDKLDDLKKSEKLHKHQADLIRILRYRNNWRLRETVLLNTSHTSTNHRMRC